MIKLSDLNLLKRTIKAASKNGIRTIKDLTNLTKGDIIMISCMGGSTEIKYLSKSLGLNKNNS